MKLYPQQQEVYEGIMSDKVKFAALCCHRRYGKDVLALQTIVSYALKVKGVYFYLAPFRTQIKQIILEGQMYNGVSFLDMIPDEAVIFTERNKKYKADDLSIRFKNGSTLFFKGCDNPDSIVGAGATGVVFTEFALINPIFYRYFRPIVSRVIEETGNGFFLFISTPRGLKNHFTELFYKYIPRNEDTPTLKRIKEKWMLRWINAKSSVKHNGERMLTDEFLEQERIELGNDIFEQEYMLSLTSSNEALWFGKQMRIMDKEERLTELGIWYNENMYSGYIIPNQRVYVSFDLGTTDAYCLTFFQKCNVTGKIRVFYFFEDTGKVTEYYISEMKMLLDSWNVKDYLCILPHDADFNIDRGLHGNDKFNTATKRTDIFKYHGIRVVVVNRTDLGMQKARKMTRISTIRKYLEKDVIIDTVNCFALIEALKSYRKKYNKASATYEDVPVHDWSSDKVDSLGYGLMYMENYYKENLDENFERQKGY